MEGSVGGYRGARERGGGCWREGFGGEGAEAAVSEEGVGLGG